MRTEMDSHEARADRLARLRRAFAAAVLGKVITGASLLFGLFIAGRWLAVDEFSLYGRIATLLGWLTLANVGVGPGATLALSRARAIGDRKAVDRLVRASLFLAALVGTVIAVGGLALFVAFDGASHFDGPVPLAGFVVLAGLVTVGLPVVAAIDAIAAGLSETHRVSIWASIGGIIGTVALACSLRLGVSDGALLAMLGPIGHLLSRLLLFDGLRRADVVGFRRERTSRPMLRELLSLNLHYSLAQLGGWLALPVSVYFVPDGAPSALLFTTITLMTPGFGLATSVMLPTLPAIVDALTRGDDEWYRNATRSLVRGLAVVVGGACLVCPLAAPVVLRAFGDGPPSGALYGLAAAMAFSGVLAVYMLFTLAMATGRIAFGSKCTLVHGLSNVALLAAFGRASSSGQAALWTSTLAAIVPVAALALSHRQRSVGDPQLV